MTLNPELYMVFLPGIAGILFALGGTQISDEQGGIKWFRKFGLTLLFFLAAGFKVVWWQSALTAVSTFALLSLSMYGSTHSWLNRWITIVAFGLVGCSLGLSAWNLITAVAFLFMFLLSNSNMTRLLFVWKIVEFATGAFMGVQVAYSLMGHGWTWMILK